MAVTVFGRWLGLHASFFYPPLYSRVPAVFATVVGGYYFWREFGKGGDYWKRKKGHDSQSDSVLDFWFTLPAIYAAFMLPIVYAVLVSFFMMAGIYILAHYGGDYDG
jgi:hypothetical protein